MFRYAKTQAHTHTRIYKPIKSKSNPVCVQTTLLWKQQQKATAQLNQEKQEFNIHVLMHREKDSMIIQSKLKRKINRSHTQYTH